MTLYLLLPVKERTKLRKWLLKFQSKGYHNNIFSDNYTQILLLGKQAAGTGINYTHSYKSNKGEDTIII